MFKKALVTIALMTLAACGGGGSNPIPVPVSHVTPTPSSNFPKASGKAMAFVNNLPPSRSAQSVHAMAATPTPAGSATPAPTPTPLPTAVPLPTPSGNPLVPTRIAVGNGPNAGVGGGMNFEVVDAQGNPVQETTAPTMISQWPDVVKPLTPYSNPQTFMPDAWSAGFAFQQPTSAHVQMAAEFPDSTGIVDVYIYDAFAVRCDGATTANLGGATPAVSLQNCGSNPLTASIPGGFMVAAPVQPDSYGQITPAFNNLLQVPANWTNQGTTLDASQWPGLVGEILVIKDGAGGYHKIMVAALTYDTSGVMNGFIALDLAADLTGAFAF